MNKAYYKSPISLLEILSGTNGIEAISFIDDSKIETTSDNFLDEYLLKCIKELDEYFQGKRTEFTVKIHIQGTEFQKKVWMELMKIPYGKTVSYKNIATAIGNPNASRAVGSANNNNKIPIIIPCHRVIGANGNLVGYASGLKNKQFLIETELKNI